jgi:hypothetical protein
MNCRIGNLQEGLNDVDEITDRTSIDSTINQHGHKFIEFLSEANFCILNGRFPDDNFTCISRKGKSVVDYISVPVDIFRYVMNFKVLTVQSIVDDFKLHEFIGEKFKLPDHSDITCEFSVTEYDLIHESNKVESTKPRFNLNRFQGDFMSSELCRSGLLIAIKQKITGKY